MVAQLPRLALSGLVAALGLVLDVPQKLQQLRGGALALLGERAARGRPLEGARRAQLGEDIDREPSRLLAAELAEPRAGEVVELKGRLLEKRDEVRDVRPEHLRCPGGAVNTEERGTGISNLGSQLLSSFPPRRNHKWLYVR